MKAQHSSLTTRKRVITTLMAALLTTVASPFAHATVVYDEATSGDLGDLAGLSPVISIFEGVNTVRGIAGAGDTDDFIVGFDTSLTLVGGVFTASFGTGRGAGFYNSNGVPVVAGGTFQGQFSGPITVDIASFDFNGLFRVQNLTTDEPIPDLIWQFDFTLEAASQTVPEPATALLAALGLLGVGVARRQRTA